MQLAQFSARRLNGRLFTSVFLATAIAAALSNTKAQAQDTQASAPDNSFWSRVTVETPLLTRHFPDDQGFNDRNWGGWVDVAVTKWISIDGGDFINSYYRNTAFAAVEITPPYSLTVSKIRFSGDVMLGADLNGGYKGYLSVDPFLAAVQFNINGTFFQNTRYEILDRVGLVVTIIPSWPDFPVNLGLSYHF